jgi:hypothetical protein
MEGKGGGEGGDKGEGGGEGGGSRPCLVFWSGSEAARSEGSAERRRQCGSGHKEGGEGLGGRGVTSARRFPSLLREPLESRCKRAPRTNNACAGKCRTAR